MNDESAPTGAPQPVVVHAVLADEPAGTVERWFQAVLTALTGAAALGAIGPWRIAVGLAAGASAEGAVPASFEERARLAGGEFSLGPVAAGEGGHADSVALCSAAGGGLVILLDPRSVILATTVVRLVRAFDGLPLAARQLPVDSGGSQLCVVASVAGFAQGDPRQEPVPVCPEAAVAAIPDRVVGGHAPTSGSLLEDSVVLAPARALVAERLGAAGEQSLSVVMRTQGARPEALRDAVLTLAAQSDGRFELLLVVHDTGRDVADAVLAEQPEWLTSRTSILGAEGGTRSRPLNVGIEAASGTLVAFLDDDDVVFGNWVSLFVEGAAEHPRRLLRATAGVQAVTTAAWPGGLQGHSADPVLETPYPTAFDLPDHLRVNMTPFMALAFPRGFFSVFGAADEELEVCEDWDLLLRAASTLGVADLAQLTAVYRRWSSGGDSYSRHDSAAWERDMRRVREKLDAGPLILPAGSASELAALSALRDVRDELDAVRASTSWRLTGPVRAAGVLWSRLSGPRREDG